MRSATVSPDQPRASTDSVHSSASSIAWSASQTFARPSPELASRASRKALLQNSDAAAPLGVHEDEQTSIRTSSTRRGRLLSALDVALPSSHCDSAQSPSPLSSDSLRSSHLTSDERRSAFGGGEEHRSAYDAM